MKERPPEPLTQLVAGLGLATADQLAGLGGRARRLARGLPRFASVWVDAALQAGLLSPFQAAQINAGRGESLRVGPWVLCRRLAGLGYAECFEARRIDSGRRARLAVIESSAGLPPTLSARLADLADRAAAFADVEGLSAVEATGTDGPRHWAACRWIDAPTAAEWMIHHGRLPPEAVVRIAQRMMPALLALHRAGLAHGDLRAGTLLLGGGEVVLPWAGLRGLVRPSEGFAHADLPPEALDGLAPERITRGEPPTAAADLFACGYLWWHLLAGRSPVLGGDGLAKLRGLSRATLPDARRVAADVPERLLRAIAASTAADPADRPTAADELAAILGPAEPAHQRRLVAVLALGSRRETPWNRPLPLGRLARLAAIGLAAVAACGLVAGAIAWSIGRGAVPGAPGATAALPDSAPGATAGLPSSVPTTPNATAGLPRATAGLPSSAPPSSSSDDLVLRAKDAFDGLSLQPGQRVRGEGQGVRVRVPPEGLSIRVPDVRFENIEFLWDQSTSSGPTRPAAIVRLEAAEATFRQCKFRSKDAAAAAVLWTHPIDRSAAGLALSSGRVVLEDCVLENVSAGVDCRTVCSLAIECRNTLALGPGPLVRLDHGPRADEPVAIRLNRATLRGSGPLLECRGVEDGPAAAISIESVESVLLPREGEPLLLLAGQRPRALVEKLRWSGAGSVVATATAIARWQSPEGQAEPLDDAAISIEGLVRGEVTFAGPPTADPATSQVADWQAPLRSTSPPGIDPSRLRGWVGQAENPPPR